MVFCLGLNKGIHTVIIAMTSCNDVIAIFLFGVLCGIVFSTGDLTHQLLQGPVGVVMGYVFGSLSGLLVLRLPSDKSVCLPLYSIERSFGNCFNIKCKEIFIRFCSIFLSSDLRKIV